MNTFQKITKWRNNSTWGNPQYARWFKELSWIGVGSIAVLAIITFVFSGTTDAVKNTITTIAALLFGLLFGSMWTILAIDSFQKKHPIK